MLWHLGQLILEFVSLDVELHQVLLDVGNLRGFVRSLSKLWISLHTSRPNLLLLTSVSVETALEVI